MQTRDVVKCVCCVVSVCVKYARRGRRRPQQNCRQGQHQLSAHQRRLLAAALQPDPLPCARFDKRLAKSINNSSPPGLTSSGILKYLGQASEKWFSTDPEKSPFYVPRLWNTLLKYLKNNFSLTLQKCSIRVVKYLKQKYFRTDPEKSFNRIVWCTLSRYAKLFDEQFSPAGVMTFVVISCSNSMSRMYCSLWRSCIRYKDDIDHSPITIEVPIYH